MGTALEIPYTPEKTHWICTYLTGPFGPLANAGATDPIYVRDSYNCKHSCSVRSYSYSRMQHFSDANYVDARHDTLRWNQLDRH